jgi:hypothetical protein
MNVLESKREKMFQVFQLKKAHHLVLGHLKRKIMRVRNQKRLFTHIIKTYRHHFALRCSMVIYAAARVALISMLRVSIVTVHCLA